MRRALVTNLHAGSLVLAPDLARHLVRVLRLTKGATFLAFDPAQGSEAIATVERIDEQGNVTCQVGLPYPGAVKATVPLVLVQGLPKGDKSDAIVQDATELGASCVIFATCERSIVKLAPDKVAQRLARYKRIAEGAARQCGRSDVPEVIAHVTWAEGLRHASSLTQARFCLYEKATIPLGEGLARALDQQLAVAFAVGPEGGLSEAEVEAARTADFEVVSLGPFVLRTETVAAAALGAARVYTT